MDFEDHKRLRAFHAGYLLQLVVEERDEMLPVAAVHFGKKIKLAGRLEQVGDFRQLGNFVGDLIEQVGGDGYADHGRFIPPQLLGFDNAHDLQFVFFGELSDTPAYGPLCDAKFRRYFRKGQTPVILEKRNDRPVKFVQHGFIIASFGMLSMIIDEIRQ